MQSIKQVANTHGVTDRTVRNWLSDARQDGKELGTMRSGKLYFTAEEVAELSSYGRQSDTEVLETEFVVDEGNHREIKTLSVPNFSSLEQFRTGRIRQGLANPTHFVGQVGGYLDELEHCMTIAESEQERELAQTRQTKRLAQQRIDRFRRRADEYRIKTDILASIQNAELDEIDDLAGEVSAMGKPPEESPQDGLK